MLLPVVASAPVVVGRLLLALLLLPAATLQAEVVTDGTVGPAMQLNGPLHSIGEELGQRHGSNLFHSFSRFSLDRGEEARFGAGESVERIIGRVTGGVSSTINGLVSTTSPADLYLFNPAGIVVGPEGSFQLAGSLHLSTAAELRLADGGRFSATDPAASRLTMAPIDGWWFAGSATGELALVGSQLEFRGSGRHSLSAGSIRISGSEESPATWVQQGGSLRLVAVGDAARLVDPDVAPSAVAATDDPGRGRVTIDHGSIELMGEGSIEADELVATSSGLAVVSDDTPQPTALELGVGRLQLLAGSTINSYATGGEAGGELRLRVDGESLIRDGSGLLSVALAAGDGGAIRLESGSLKLVGNGELSGLVSFNGDQSTGRSGEIAVAVAGDAVIDDGGWIGSRVFGEGGGGAVGFSAGSLAIDGSGDAFLQGLATGVGSQGSGSGELGRVEVQVDGAIGLQHGGSISSSGFGAGDSGTVVVRAGSLHVNGAGSERFTGVASSSNRGVGNSGRLELQIEERLTVVNGGQVTSSSFGEGRAGVVDVDAGQLLVDGAGERRVATSIGSTSEGGTVGDAGQLRIRVRGEAVVRGGGAISTNALGDGNAGTIDLSAGSLRIEQQGIVISSANAIEPQSRGSGGAVSIRVANRLLMSDESYITAFTGNRGDGGTISIEAGAVTLQRRAGVVASASTTAAGDAGSIDLRVAGDLVISSGSQLQAATFGDGRAGRIAVRSGSLLIDRAGDTQVTGIGSSSEGLLSGDAGGVELIVDGRLQMANSALITSASYGVGDAGSINLSAGEVVMESGGQISSSTYGSGHAGQVTIASEGVTLTGEGPRSLRITAIGSTAEKGSSGNAGSVAIRVDGPLILERGGTQISSSTFGRGAAGRVAVSAESIRLSGEGLEAQRVAGIGSTAEIGSSGNAGSVSVSSSGPLLLRNGGQISSRSWAGGEVGSVVVDAERLELVDGGLIDISSLDRNAPAGATNTLLVRGGSLQLSDGSMISAASRGRRPASEIVVESRGVLSLNDSLVTTSAEQGDGGSIDLSAGRIDLGRSQVTTSVSGTAGSGGDIALHAPALILDNGFIQANTAAAGGSGGAILVDVAALVAQEDSLEVGGDQRHLFEPDRAARRRSVIQAAAPGGESGLITLARPATDFTTLLTPLQNRTAVAIPMVADPCVPRGGEPPSRLAIAGRGGVPSGSGSGWLPAAQLERLALAGDPCGRGQRE